MFSRSIALVIALGATVMVLPHTPAGSEPQSPPSSRRTGTITPCAAQPDTLQHMYVPLAHLRHFDFGELVLNNNGIDAMTVRPVWYVRGAGPVPGRALTLAPLTMEFQQIRDLLPDGVPAARVDGLHIEYDGKLLELGGQVVVRRSAKRNGGSLDAHFSMTMDFQSPRREATWTSARGESAMLVLANTADYPLDVRIASPDKARRVTIDAYQTHLVRLEDTAATSHRRRGTQAMWAVLDSNGQPGDLRATGFVMAERSAPRLIRFYDPSAAKQSHLYATRMRVDTGTGDMALKNTSALPVVARTEFLDPDSGQPLFEMAPVTLEPNAAQTIELRAALAALSKIVESDAVSVRVESNGPAGSLIGSLYVHDTATGTPFDVPLRDSGAARSSTGSYPWRIDDDYQTRVSITNAGIAPAKFAARIGHTGGELVFEPGELAPGASATFDLRALRDQATTDRTGRSLPVGADHGRFMWTVHGGGQSARLVGRAEIVSHRLGVSSSYSCGQCCPDSFLWGWVTPTHRSIVVDASDTYTVEGHYQNCYGSTYDMGVWPSWNVQFPNVASIYTQDWGVGRVSGSSGGGSDLSALWGVEDWTPDMDDCVVESWTHNQPAAVQVKVPTSLSVVSNSYTDSPPPPYVRVIRYQILDQNGQAMTGYAPNGLHVTETYTPNPASGNCSSAQIATGDGWADANGQFPDSYTLGGTPPNPCSSSSTQKHFVNGRQVSTKNVTWTYGGVTVQ